jgi:hypothetical protein
MSLLPDLQIAIFEECLGDRKNNFVIESPVKRLPVSSNRLKSVAVLPFKKSRLIRDERAKNTEKGLDDKQGDQTSW